MPSRRAARAARSFRAAAMTACSQLCRSATDVLSAISLPPRVGRWIERLIGGRELAFDAHRVGLFVYAYEQGLSLDPEGFQNAGSCCGTVVFVVQPAES